MAHVYIVRMSWFLVGCIGFLLQGGTPLVAAGEETLSHSEEYFPDTVGSRWQYRGEILDSPIQTIAARTFSNVSSVQGVSTHQGATVKKFHDTNPGNHGPSDSYYRRDAAGVIYYGSEPGTTLERQLVPYQIVRFPLVVPSSFQQFDRKNVDFDADLDGDDTTEHADVEATVALLARESLTVPAGTYPDVIRIEARMTMHIHLSGAKQSVTGTDVMTAWFARGVGLVKYVERQELPAVRSERGLVTEIVEELEEVEIKP